MRSRIVTVSIVAAIVVACLIVGNVFAQQGGNDRAAQMKEAAAKPTPRASDGHPDLTGYWADRLELGFGYNIPVTKSADGKTVVYHDADAPELPAAPVQASVCGQAARNDVHRQPHRSGNPLLSIRSSAHRCALRGRPDTYSHVLLLQW